MVLVHDTSSHCALEVNEASTVFNLQSGQKIAFYNGNMKIKHARVMILVHDTLSECALQMYEVLFKYL